MYKTVRPTGRKGAFMEGIEKLKEMINGSSRIVFLGGAGVSTESGIPDFRSENGIFNAIREYGYPPETLLSRSFFDRDPETFFKYYRGLLMTGNAKPNAAHYALARLEERGKLTAIATQNIDGLHTAAGSKNVYELHGSIMRNHCMKCHKFYDADFIANSDGVPRCTCGGIIKPDVVLYEEGLDHDTLMGAITHVMRADMLIVGGTSLQVYPAAGLIDYYRGDKLVLINKSSTPYDRYADFVINDSIGKVLGETVE